jgi:hypothetical protein
MRESSMRKLKCLPNVFPMSAQCLPNVCPKSAQCLPNVFPMSSQCLPNVFPMCAKCLPNVCPMSAQCLPNVFPMSSQCLPSVNPMSAQCSICLPNVPKFCPMSFAVKSRISSDMFSENLALLWPRFLNRLFINLLRSVQGPQRSCKKYLKSEKTQSSLFGGNNFK